MHLAIAQQNTKFHLLFASTKEILGKQKIINLNMNGKQTICFIKESLLVNNKSDKSLFNFIEKLRSSKNYFQNKKKLKADEKFNGLIKKIKPNKFMKVLLTKLF